VAESAHILKPGDPEVHDPLPDEGDWFVLHTRPRQEKALVRELQSRDIGIYLPTREQVRFYGRRKAVSDLPMFPGYVFLRGTREDTFTADRTRRVVQIITVGDQQQIDWELRNIYLASCLAAPLEAYPYLKEGVRVEVRSGPFRGLQGIVEQRLKADRILLQIDMLGRALALEVDASLLDPL